MGGPDSKPTATADVQAKTSTALVSQTSTATQPGESDSNNTHYRGEFQAVKDLISHDAKRSQDTRYTLQYLRVRAAHLVVSEDQLPCGWSTKNKHLSLVVAPDGRVQVDVTVLRRDMWYKYPVMVVKANRPLTNRFNFFYFEVSFIDMSPDLSTWCGVGLGHANIAPDTLEGNQFAYLGDGQFRYRKTIKKYGPKFGPNDTIGCGFRRIDGTVFFTKNGMLLGSAATGVFLGSEVYPQAYLAGPTTQLEANFGRAPFEFNVDQYCSPYNFSRKSFGQPLPGELVYKIVHYAIEDETPDYLKYNLPFYRYRQRLLRAMALVCRFWSKAIRPAAFHTIALCDKNDINLVTDLIKVPPNWCPLSYSLPKYILVVWLTSRNGEPHRSSPVFDRAKMSSLLFFITPLPALLSSTETLYWYGLDAQDQYFSDPFSNLPPDLVTKFSALTSQFGIRGVHTLRLHAHRFKHVGNLVRIITHMDNLHTLQADSIQFVETYNHDTPPSWMRPCRKLRTLDVKDCQHSCVLLCLFLHHSTRHEHTASGSLSRLNLDGRFFVVVRIVRVLLRLSVGISEEEMDGLFQFEEVLRNGRHEYKLVICADGTRTVDSDANVPRIVLIFSPTALRCVIFPWDGVWGAGTDVGAELAALDRLTVDNLGEDRLNIRDCIVRFVALDSQAEKDDEHWKGIKSKMLEKDKAGKLTVVGPGDKKKWDAWE